MTNAKFNEAMTKLVEENESLESYRIQHSMEADTSVTSALDVVRNGYMSRMITTNKNVSRNLATLWRMAKTLVVIHRFRKNAEETVEETEEATEE